MRFLICSIDLCMNTMRRASALIKANYIIRIGLLANEHGLLIHLIQRNPITKTNLHFDFLTVLLCSVACMAKLILYLCPFEFITHGPSILMVQSILCILAKKSPCNEQHIARVSYQNQCMYVYWFLFTHYAIFDVCCALFCLYLILNVPFMRKRDGDIDVRNYIHTCYVHCH